MMRRAVIGMVVTCGVLVTALGSASLAAAQDGAASPALGDGVTITQIDASRFPVVRVAFGADDVTGETPKLTYFEDGERLSGVSFYRGPLGSFENRTRTDLMLVIDTSLSMGNGDRFDDARDAAASLLSHARPGDQIGLATFGGAAKVLVPPTTNHGAIEEALASLELQNRTTMFDAVSKAARAFDTEVDANRAIVLLSDGTDAGSVETLDESIAEALKVRAPIFAVAIREREGDQPADLAGLANGADGEVRTIVDTATLESLFDDLGRRILQPYWVEYRSQAPARSRIEFGIAAGERGGIDATSEFRGVAASTANGRILSALPPSEPAAAPLIPMPGGMLGVLVASIPFALLIFFSTWRWLERRYTPDVVARIDRYTARASIDAAPLREAEQNSLTRRIATPLMRLGDAFLGRSAFFDRTRARAEQANIAIKPNELFAAMIANAFLGGLIGLLIGRSLLTLLLVVAFGFLPNFWLRMKARKRCSTFEDQLADVLGGIASSLRAGHSFNQAINAMIKDAPAPTSEEFARVMTEARLGMPLEDALQHMADRMASDDFDFAVTTVNIQRTVGGSLADILEMVGDTVRNRQQFRKKVKALTSMGQMSAYVLLGMPLFIGVALTLINAQYMAPLFTTPTGHMLLIAGAFSMTLGYFACMKVVSVKV